MCQSGPVVRPMPWWPSQAAMCGVVRPRLSCWCQRLRGPTPGMLRHCGTRVRVAAWQGRCYPARWLGELLVSQGSAHGALASAAPLVRVQGWLPPKQELSRVWGHVLGTAAGGRRGLPAELGCNTKCVGCEIIKHHLSVCIDSHLNQETNNKMARAKKGQEGLLTYHVDIERIEKTWLSEL